MKTGLKQIDLFFSAVNQHRAIASEIAGNATTSRDTPLASGLQNHTHQPKLIIQRKPGEDEELPLQRMLIGNQNGVLQAFRPAQSTNNNSGSGKLPFIQTKLSINAPGDQYEQEADAMADKVMRMKDPFLPSSRSDTFSIQRKCAVCEGEDKHIHRKENSASETPGSDELDSYVSSLNSSGQLLPESSRQFFEPRFGQDFSNVRVHTDSVATKSAQSINALAYTTGNNIVFNEGQYAPGSESGQRLMAHELTHVVQQSDKANIQLMVQRDDANDHDLPGEIPQPLWGTFFTPNSRPIKDLYNHTLNLDVNINYLPSHTYLHVFVSSEAGGEYRDGQPLQIIGEPGKGGNYGVSLSPVPDTYYLRFEARSELTGINVPRIEGDYYLELG